LYTIAAASRNFIKAITLLPTAMSCSGDRIMNTRDDHGAGRLLTNWVAGAHTRAGWVLALTLIATIGILVFVSENLGINTDTADMIDEALPFRQAVKDYDRAFPHAGDTLLVVIDGATPDLAEDAASALADRFAQYPTMFKSVYQPGGDAFFSRNGLLYLDIDELNDLADNLAKVQPLIASLADDPSLRGLLGLLQTAVTESEAGETASFDLAAAFDRLSAAIEAAMEGKPYYLSWREVMTGESPSADDHRAFLLVQPNLDYTSLQPQKQALGTVRAMVAELGLTPDRGVQVRLTGSVALNYDQLDSARHGAEIAGPVSFILVGLVLLIGLRSVRLVVAALVTLLVGLVWAAGFAALAIGSLNLISIAFAVLFISLGADFSIHMCLRYRELVADDTDRSKAVAAAGRQVGGALFLCAVTTAAGFYVFIPTDYVGVSELGLIAGTSMFISLAANFTVLPAMLRLVSFGPGVTPARETAGTTEIEADFPLRYRRVIRVVAALVMLASIPLVLDARFDFSPLNLHDPTAESVTTLQDLLSQSEHPPWTLNVLAKDRDEAAALAARLGEVDGVRQTITLTDYLPTDQDVKLELIEEMAFFMGPAPGQTTPPPDDRQRLAAIQSLSQALGQSTDVSAQRLKVNLDRLSEQPDRFPVVERSMLDGFAERLRRLYMALEPFEPITLDDLPRSLVEREVAVDGRVRIRVFARDDLTDNDALRRFVENLRVEAPTAVGNPIEILESGDAVVGAFQQALLSAVIVIVVLLFVLMRRFADVAYVMAPLLLAALLTIAASVIFVIPFNFANVIVLPLLLGIGVDSAIHLVYRYRKDPGQRRHMLRSSTARGVVLSALTTICGFGSLALSTHRGTATMGELLTIGVSLTLVCTLLVLPALLHQGTTAAGD
jgi:hopanoid biosynthesis associated RND transporter like protein HpnN